MIFGSGELYQKYKPFWKTLMTSYNALMCLYSLFTCVLSIYTLYHNSGVLSGSEARAPYMVELSYAFFISKYVEYLDTIFLIVAGKPVSTLQYCK